MMLSTLLPQGFPDISVGKECRRPGFNSWVRKTCWRRDRLPTPVFWGFPCGSTGKESARNAGDLGSIPVLRSGFDPCLGKISWRREQLPTPVFLLGEFHGLEDHGRLQSMGSRRVWHDWETNVTQELNRALRSRRGRASFERNTINLPLFHRLCYTRAIHLLSIAT